MLPHDTIIFSARAESAHTSSVLETPTPGDKIVLDNVYYNLKTI